MTVVNFKLKGDYTETNGGMFVEFDIRLQYHGSDYRVFTNNSSATAPANYETIIVFCVLRALLTNPRSGIESIVVSPFRLQLHKSCAVDTEIVMKMIEDGIVAAGFEPVRMPN